MGENGRTPMDDNETWAKYNEQKNSKIEITIAKAVTIKINMQIINSLSVGCVPFLSKSSKVFLLDIQNHQTISYLKNCICKRIGWRGDIAKINLIFDDIILDNNYNGKTIRQVGISNGCTLKVIVGVFYSTKNIVTEDNVSNEAPQPNVAPIYETDAEKHFKKIAKNGKITVEQAADLACKLGYSPSCTDVREFKTANGAQIDFSGFQNFLAAILHTEDDIDTLSAIFQEFDPDGTGIISKKQMRWILIGWGEYLSNAEVEIVLRTFSDKGDEVNYKKFLEKVLEGRV